MTTVILTYSQAAKILTGVLGFPFNCTHIGCMVDDDELEPAADQHVTFDSVQRYVARINPAAAQVLAEEMAVVMRGLQ
jgi:hypothetical protein